MSFSVIVRTEAQIDLEEIFVWYEEQQVGLGFEFLQGIEDVIQKILHNPYYASAIEEARAASLKRFPYEIVYRIDQQKQQVRVIAVIHQHRNPEWFRQRL